MIDNPNEYDDTAYTQASVEAGSWIGTLWSAGASADEVAQIVKDGLLDAGASVTEVTVR